MNLETMRLLVAKGLTAADLLEVAESMAVRPDRTGAERQARHRAKVAAEREAVTRDVTRDVTGVTNPPLSPPPLSSPQTPQQTPPPHTPPDITSRARKGPFPMLDCTDPETWGDFLRNRAKKRLPNTASAHRKLETDLAAMAAHTGWPPGKVFAECVARGWGAIYDPREKSDGRQQLQPANGFAGVRGKRPNPALDMVLEAERELQAEAERENPWPDWPPGAALPAH